MGIFLQGFDGIEQPIATLADRVVRRISRSTLARVAGSASAVAVSGSSWKVTDTVRVSSGMGASLRAAVRSTQASCLISVIIGHHIQSATMRPLHPKTYYRVLADLPYSPR